jgi:hypothetical protein
MEGLRHAEPVEPRGRACVAWFDKLTMRVVVLQSDP